MSQGNGFSLLAKVLNGSIASVIGSLVVFPLDFVKTRLQTLNIQEGGKHCDSILECIRKTYKTYSLLGLYRGYSTVLVLSTPEKALSLAGNDFFRHYLKTAEGELPLGRQVLAGGLAACLHNIITNPKELLKIKMQTASKEAIAKNVSALQIATGMIRKYGIRGMYRGITLTLTRDITYCGIYFPLFARLNDLGPKRHDGTGEAVFWCSFLSGCAAGAFTAVIVTPIDVVKSRIQALKMKEFCSYYTNITDVFVKLYRHEGVKGFFQGGACRVMVIMPLSGVMQSFYYIGLAEMILGMRYYHVG